MVSFYYLTAKFWALLLCDVCIQMYMYMYIYAPKIWCHYEIAFNKDRKLISILNTSITV